MPFTRLVKRYEPRLRATPRKRVVYEPRLRSSAHRAVAATVRVTVNFKRGQGGRATHETNTGTKQHDRRSRGGEEHNTSSSTEPEL